MLVPEYRGTREIPREAGGTTLQGELPLATDSAQYREGKVKSTPEGGFKVPETARSRAVGAWVSRVTACLLKNEPASCSASRG